MRIKHLAEDEFLKSVEIEIKGEIYKKYNEDVKAVGPKDVEQLIFLKEQLTLELKKLMRVLVPLKQNTATLKLNISTQNIVMLSPHDVVNLNRIKIDEIVKKGIDLYRKGFSMNAIARELKISRSAVRLNLIKNGIHLRRHSKNQNKSDSSNPLAIRNAPFGYFLLSGSLVEDLREQNILKIIIHLNGEGLSQGAIVKHLNSFGYKPRNSKEWKQPTISIILKRLTITTSK